MTLNYTMRRLRDRRYKVPQATLAISKRTIFRSRLLQSIVLIGTLGTTAVPAVSSAIELPDVEQQLAVIMDDNAVMGLAAGIAKNGRVRWTAGLGLADQQSGALVADDTIFNQASVAKMITAVAAMQLVDRGQVGLDDDLNLYLPFHLAHPSSPDTPITLRHVLTHTTGIRDDLNVFIEAIEPGDPTQSLRGFLERYLSIAGDLYDPDENFVATPPGTAYQYSNFGFGLAALLVEEVTGQSFRNYTKKQIFRPLGMKDTGWFLADIDVDRLAVPHELEQGVFEPIGHYGYPVYSSGLLRTTAADLGNFLGTMANYGARFSKRILSLGAAEQMLTVQYPAIDPTQGLGFVCLTPPQCNLWGHNGGDPGVETLALFDPESNDAVWVMSNSNTGGDDVPGNELAQVEMIGTLFEAGEGVQPPPSFVIPSIWHDRMQPGHSMSLNRFGKSLFVLANSYDAVTGEPIWLSGLGRMNGQFADVVLNRRTALGDSTAVGQVMLRFDAGQSEVCGGGDRGDARSLAHALVDVDGEQIAFCLEPLSTVPQQ